MVKLDEDVRGRDVFIIQPTCAPQNDSLMELLIFIDCARRASAERIAAVMPYFGYARQDRKDEGRVPITAKLVANLISTAGADRVLTMDLHAAQVQGFFDIPVDNLYAEPVLSRHYAEKSLPDLVLVSPDVGNAKRARVYAQRLGGWSARTSATPSGRGCTPSGWGESWPSSTSAESAGRTWTRGGSSATSAARAC
jgi:ribose-phosphate pyrophosphokinase